MNPPLYFHEATLHIPYIKYNLVHHQNCIEQVQSILAKLAILKKSRVRSLKNMCAHTITKFGTQINRGEIPDELLEYVGNHRIKHRKLFPIFMYNTYQLNNWSIGTMYNDKYYIFHDRDNTEGNTVYVYPLTKDMFERLNKYNTKSLCDSSGYNLHLRLCPHIDLPILNSF